MPLFSAPPIFMAAFPTGSEYTLHRLMLDIITANVGTLGDVMQN